jgi:hypothetical protein
MLTKGKTQLVQKKTNHGSATLILLILQPGGMGIIRLLKEFGTGGQL